MILSFAACGSEDVTDSRGSIRVAYPSEQDFADVPSVMAQQILERHGYGVTRTFYASPELAAQALAGGDADIAYGATRTYWVLAAQGAKVVTILQDARDENLLVVRSGIETCRDLEGGRVGYTSEGAMSATLLRAYVVDECPGTTPHTLLVAGSSARAAGLLAGSLDAAVLKRADLVAVARKASAQVAVLEEFGRRWPDLVTTAVYVNTDFASAHPRIVDAYVRSSLVAYRQVAKDSSRLAAQARAQLGDDADWEAIAEAYVRAGTWSMNGGLSREGVEQTLTMLADDSALGKRLRSAPVIDRRYLERALAALDSSGSDPGEGSRPTSR